MLMRVSRLSVTSTSTEGDAALGNRSLTRVQHCGESTEEHVRPLEATLSRSGVQLSVKQLQFYQLCSCEWWLLCITEEYLVQGSGPCCNVPVNMCECQSSPLALP